MRPSLVRKVATGVLLLDALVVGAAAVQVSNVVTRTTTAQPSGTSAPAAPGSAVAVSPGSPGALVPVASLTVAPLGETGNPFAGVLEGLGASAGTGKPPSSSGGPTVTPNPGAGGVPESGQLPPCPIQLSDPGIQAAVSPILTPLASSLGAVLAQGLEAETQLAAALAPYTQTLTSNELGGCIAELQNALLAASGLGTPGVPGSPAIDLSTLVLGGLR
ncbi:MAG: hypothetical protein EOO67_12010 [Microbacterium sp.]|nr:MAG: hypothetical protein EOO67_12010 [Microbacterium sp.]